MIFPQRVFGMSGTIQTLFRTGDLPDDRLDRTSNSIRDLHERFESASSEPADVAVLLNTKARLRDAPRTRDKRPGLREVGTVPKAPWEIRRSMVSGCVMLALNATNRSTPFLG
jgi:hypothetical protein